MEIRYGVGTTFKTRGKAPRLCTVVDALKTFNLAGELVKVRYVATHEFCGQVVFDSDVGDTSITMGLIDRVEPKGSV